MPQYPLNQPVGLPIYKYISTQTTTVVKASAGLLDRVLFWGGANGAVITAYDNATTGSGTIVFQCTLGAALNAPIAAIVCDALFVNGLTIVTSTANPSRTVIAK